jgi:hypothetical protein
MAVPAWRKNGDLFGARYGDVRVSRTPTRRAEAGSVWRLGAAARATHVKILLAFIGHIASPAVP